MVAARYSDIIINGGGRKFLMVRAESNKIGESRKVLLTQPALDAIEALREHCEGDELIPARHRNYYYDVIRRAAIAAGWNMDTHSVGLHTLRHSFCSHWANMPGIPLAWVRDWAGHSNLSITDRYVHADEDVMDSTLTKLGY